VLITPVSQNAEPAQYLKILLQLLRVLFMHETISDEACFCV